MEEKKSKIVELHDLRKQLVGLQKLVFQEIENT